jgi:hypothetical protein
MRLSARSAAWLLPLLLTGCIHKSQVAQSTPLAPPIEDVPPAIHMPPPSDLPPPDVTAPVQQPAPVVTTPPPAPPKKPAKHKKPANSPTTQTASSGAAPVPAIGQLSSGDPPDLRQQTDSSIVAIEKSLNGINRNLSDQERKTAAQIREYLKEARTALSSGDIDGAHTLATKAKVLLDELHP